MGNRMINTGTENEDKYACDIGLLAVTFLQQYSLQSSTGTVLSWGKYNSDIIQVGPLIYLSNTWSGREIMAQHLYNINTKLVKQILLNVLMSAMYNQLVKPKLSYQL